MKANEMKVREPFSVAPAGEGCPHCGAGEQYEVVFNLGKEDEFMLSQTYGEREEAEGLSKHCNDAYAKGFFALQSKLKAASDPLTDAEKEQLNKATDYAMGDTWSSRLFPLIDKVLAARGEAI